MPAARGTGHFPLSAIHLVTVGDVRGDEFMAFKAGASKALISKPAGPRTAGYSGSANLLLKDIGESPTTFLTLAHFLQPANIKEEVFQQLILHLLRAKLMTNLREKNGLAYEVYPYSITAAADHHLAYWQTSVPAEKTERTLEEIRRELEQLPADIEKRIAGAKSRVVAELKQKFKSMQAIEVTVLDMIEYRRSPDYFARLMEALDTLDPAEFAAFVKQKATPSQFRLMMFTTPKQIQGLQARGETMQLVSDQ
jgi:predicted Zn-dependent peptidase